MPIEAGSRHGAGVLAENLRATGTRAGRALGAALARLNGVVPCEDVEFEGEKKDTCTRTFSSDDFPARGEIRCVRRAGRPTQSGLFLKGHVFEEKKDTLLLLGGVYEIVDVTLHVLSLSLSNAAAAAAAPAGAALGAT